MLERLSNQFVKFYTPGRLLLLLAVTGFFLWMFNLSSWPVSNLYLMDISGGEGLLDLRLYYTSAELYRALQSYGEEGRSFYLHFLATDFVFIPCYSLALVLLLGRLMRAFYNANEAVPLWGLLPLGIGLFDTLENFSTLTLLLAYPARWQGLASLAGVFSLAKQLFTLLSLLLIVGYAVRLAGSGISGHRRR